MAPEDAAKKTHEGFTVTCDKCGSKVVTVENSLGFSAESGSWGSVDLVCQACDNRTELVGS